MRRIMSYSQFFLDHYFHGSRDAARRHCGSLTIRLRFGSIRSAGDAGGPPGLRRYRTIHRRGAWRRRGLDKSPGRVVPSPQRWGRSKRVPGGVRCKTVASEPLRGYPGGTCQCGQHRRVSSTTLHVEPLTPDQTGWSAPPLSCVQEPEADRPSPGRGLDGGALAARRAARARGAGPGAAGAVVPAVDRAAAGGISRGERGRAWRGSPRS